MIHYYTSRLLNNHTSTKLLLLFSLIGISSLSYAQAPENVRALPEDTQVKLTWDEVAGADKYLIYRGDSEADISTLVDSTSTTTFFDSGLTNDNLYVYAISALTGGSEGARSDTVGVVPRLATPTRDVVNLASFNGTSSFFQIDTATTLVFPSDDFSIAFWVKADATQSEEAEIGLIAKRSGVAGPYPYSISMNGKHGRVTFSRGDGTEVASLKSGKNINDGSFHHIVATKSGNDLNLFIDGISQGTVSDVTGDPTNISPIVIGKLTESGAGFLSGEIDELAIFNQALDISSITTYLQSPQPYIGTEAGLVGVWHFDEPSASTVAYDGIGNLHPAILNTATFVESQAMPTILKVTTTDPNRSSIDIAANRSINVRFGVGIDNGTVDDQSVKVNGSIAGPLTDAPTVTNSSTVVVQPSATFKSGELVSVTLTGRIKGASNEASESFWAAENFQYTVEATGGEGAFVDIGNSFGSANSNDVALSDLNGDGIIDALFANEGGNKVWTGNDDGNGKGDGTFTEAASFGNSNSKGVALADFDADGTIDAFIANEGANNLWIGDGTGAFNLNAGYGTATTNAVVAGDLNGDGFPDVFVANADANKVWFNNTDGTFEDSGRTYGTSTSTDVSIGDLDSDGDLDIAVANDGAASIIYLNNGHGIFEEGPSLGNASATGIAIGNLNGDGFQDVFIANTGGANTVWINTFFPSGPLSFSEGDNLGEADSQDIDLGDLDGDGDIDAYVVNTGANKIYLNNGNGTFSVNVEDFGAATTLAVALGDLNDDGGIDAFAANGNNEANKPWINGGCAVRDRVALLALYNNTDGDNWTDNTNWNSEEPLSNWFGVQVNSDGCVLNLELPNNGLAGQVPENLWKAINLKRLDLSGNSIVGSLSPTIKNLTALEELNVENNILSGSIPLQLDSITSLVSLNLSENRFTGNIPEIPTEGNLANLQILDLSGNDLEGEIPASLGSLSSLKYLNLSSNNPGLSGSIPAEFGNLLSLDTLDLSNNTLTGAIPGQLTNLINLKTLRLSNNGIDQIPESIQELSSLRFLYLDGNAITEIPKELGSLFSLRELSLSNNQLAGAVPEPVWSLLSLEYLALNGNQLDGELSTLIGRLDKLKYLHLGSNGFTGAIPNEIGDLNRLEFLSLADNSFTSSLPDAFSNLVNLKTLLVNDNTFAGEGIGGAIPLAFTTTLNLLETFDFRNTNVCEPVGNDTYTTWKSNITNFQTNNNVCPACLQDNREALISLFNSAGGSLWTNNTNWNTNRSLGEWFGVTTNSLGCVTGLDLSKSNTSGAGVPGNNLIGTIPTEIEGLTDLELLNVSFNKLDSLLPESIGSGLTNLKILNVSNNELDGEIPVTISGISGLEEAYLDFNKFTGALPNSISSLNELKILSFSNNQITEIPTSISSLDKIEAINGANNLLAEIPEEIWLIGTLTSLDISGNSIAGQIPSVLADINLPNLNSLNLSANKFTNFPSTITQLPLLQDLFLQENEIRDSIPSAIGELNNLVRFNISKNRFIGGVPSELGDIETLKEILLNDNDSLSGPLPLSFTQLAVTDTLIFINTSLCEPEDDGFAAWRDALIDSGGIYIGTGLCPECIKKDREALTQFYNGLQGVNWKNTVAGLSEWKTNNASSQVSAWFGISVNNEGCVVGINLSNSTGTGNDGNNLRGTIPPEIAEVTELQFFNISNNDSLGGSIPVELTTLINLEELAMNNVALEGEIPDGIWSLEKLDTLDLGNNFLVDSISPSVVNLRDLILFDLSKNQLQGELPREIGNLEKLTHLNLDSTGLSGVVPPEILSLTELQFINISDNNFTSIPNFSTLIKWSSLESEGVRIDENKLTFGSIEPNISLPDSITFLYAPQDSIEISPREYTIVEGRPINITFETDGENNQYQWFKVNELGEQTSVTAVSDTSLFLIPSTVLADSGFYLCQVTNTLATELTIPTQLIKINIVPALTTISPALTGIAPSPLLASAKDQAILGFSAVSTGSTQLTQLTFPTTSDPNGKFENVRLVRSADSSYVSMEDNVVIEDINIDLGIGQIEITSLIDTLDTVAVYYFLIADIDTTVNFTTDSIQFNFDEEDVLVTLGSVKDTTIASLEYRFAALQEILVFGNDSLIVNGDTIPTLNNSTDMGFAILGDTINRTYDIVNLGDTTLRLTGETPFIEIINDIDGLFSLTQAPDSSSIGGRDTLSFSIGFVAIDTMARDVTISIANNDTTATPYTFTLRARGTVPPVLTFTGSTLGCEGDSLSLMADALDADQYIWRNGNDTLSTDTTLVIPMVIDSVHTDSSYTLTLIKDTYTYTSDSFAITVNPFPVATFTGDPEFNTNPILCFGGELRLIADEKNADVYLWKKGDEEIGIDSILFLTEVEDTTRNDYTLTVIKNGCIAVSDSFTVKVRPQPILTFQGDTSVCENSTLELVADEIDAISYTWMKGDSILSDQRTLTIEAIPDSLAGNDYSLKVNKAFCEDSIGFSVIVKPLPTADFMGETVVCEGQRLELTALQEDADSVLWMRSDSIILSTERTYVIDTVKLENAGEDYTVMVIKDSCSTIKPFTLQVNPAPPVVISGQDSVCAIGQIYTYSAFTEGNLYDWRVEGGEIIGGFDSTFVITSDTVMMDTTQSVVFDTTTFVNFTNQIDVVWNDSIETGKVFLTETINTGDSTFACTLQDSLQTFITRFVQPRLLGINQVCEFSQGVVYAAESIENDYRWEVVGGIIVEGQNTSQIIVDWDSAGIGTVTLFEAPIEDNYCPVAVTLEVEKFSDPTVQIIGPKAVCEGATEIQYSSNTLNGVYTWTVIGGTITSKPDSSSIFVDWGPAGVGSIKLEQSFGLGQSCLADTTDIISINAIPEARVVGNRTTCVGAEDVIYTAADTTGDLYFWKITGGVITGELNGPSVSVRWQPNADSIRTGRVEMIQVTRYDSLGIECTDSDFIEINLDGTEPVSVFQQPAQTPAGIGVRFVDQSTGPDELIEWSWDFGDGREGSTEQNPIRSFESQGTYEVTMTVRDLKGCTNTSSQLIVIGPRRPDLEPLTVMNVITPNSDGQNDVLYIVNIEEYPDNEILVLNSWGTKVFGTTGYKNDWDATWNNNLLPPGNYVCVVKVNFIDAEGNETTETIKESFTILR